MAENETNKLDLISIGEAMAELRNGAVAGSRADFKVGFAGDTYNTAVYCKRSMGEGAKVGFFTRVGQDPLSAEFVVRAQEEGLDPSFIAHDGDHLIGIYSVTTDSTGERSFSYWRDNSAARQLFSHDEASQHLPDARIYYLSGITLAILSPSARRRVMDHLKHLAETKDAMIAFDSNYRPKLWENQSVARQTISEMWDIANIALPSIDDEMDLYDDTDEDAVIARFARNEWRACAIKRGVRGPVSPHLSIDLHPKFEPASKVIDTTAAGDSFNGGYLTALLQGEDETSCLQKGHALASRVVGHSGAIIRESK